MLLSLCDKMRKVRFEFSCYLLWTWGIWWFRDAEVKSLIILLEMQIVKISYNLIIGETAVG